MNTTKVKYRLNGKKQRNPGTRATYLESMTRKECATIFRARTRMIRVSENYRGMIQDKTCRVYGETQEQRRMP